MAAGASAAKGRGGEDRRSKIDPVRLARVEVVRTARCPEVPEAARPRSAVTCVLNAIEKGDSEAADPFLPLVYEKWRQLAAARLAQERPGQTLRPPRWCTRLACLRA